MNDIVASPAASPVIRMHAADNVVIARIDLPQGSTAEGIACLNRVPAGHKMATRAIAKGEPIVKYNTIIGFAGQDIRPGTLLHRHNMEFREFERDYAFCADAKPVAMVPEAKRASFMGYVDRKSVV